MADQMTPKTGAGTAGVKQTAAEAKQQAEATAERLKTEARDGVDAARRAVEDKAEREKDRAAGSLADTANALDEAASHANDGSPQQQLLSEAARGLSALADSAKGKSVGDMVGDVADFARKNPVAFLGGAALAGFAAARFAKASAKQRAEDDADISAAATSYETGSHAPQSGMSAAPRPGVAQAGVGVPPSAAGVPTGDTSPGAASPSASVIDDPAKPARA